MPIRWQVNVTVPSEAGGSSLSDAADFQGGATYMGLLLPATWATAHISFQVGNTIDGTFYDLYNEAGTEVKISGADATQRIRSLNALIPYLSQFRFVKVRSGVTGAHTDQTTSKTLTFLFER